MASLRLVNRTFHRLATPILFKYFDACFSAFGLLMPFTWGARLLEISQNPVVEEVHNMSIGVGCHRSTLGFENYLFEAAFVLPPLVHACKKLKGLRIYAPKSDVEITDHEINQSLFMKTVEQIFRRITPNAQYCTLQSLELTLPLTHDFADMANVSTEHSPMPYKRPLLGFMKDLKHLHLAVSDDSGHGGDRYFFSEESTGHRMYPNASYARDFFNFASLPDRLHSLSICATHILNMDILKIGTLRSLQTLQLMRVKVSWEILAAISNRNVSTLKSINLHQLELKSGTWEAILLAFCSLSRLERFWITACGYSADGTSRNLALGFYPALGSSIEIESRSEDDLVALGTLQRHVNQVRTLAGYEPFGDTDYRFVNMYATEYDLPF